MFLRWEKNTLTRAACDIDEPQTFTVLLSAATSTAIKQRPSSCTADPSYPGGTSLMPATPMHPSLPLQYRAPTAGRSFMPVTLPPLQRGYTTDSRKARRDKSVRRPGFSGIEAHSSGGTRNRAATAIANASRRCVPRAAPVLACVFILFQ